MESDQQKIIDRIHKLKRLASNKAASEGEIANALRAIRGLIDKYGIDERELEADLSCGRAGVHRSVASSKARHEKWEKCVAAAVARITDTKVYLSWDSDSKCEIEYVGVNQDAEIAAELFRSVVAAMRCSARLRGFESSRQFRSYCVGYAVGLDQLADKLQHNPSAETGLMVLKQDAIADYMSDQEVVQARFRRSDTDPVAMGLGRVDGKNSDLGREKIAS